MPTTNEEENEVLAHRFHRDIFQKRKMDVADEILTSDFILRNPILPSEFTHGPEGVKKFASLITDNTSEFRIMHHETISKGDKVLIRWTFSGILEKEMFGIPPSDDLTTISGFDLFRITPDGKKLAELWQIFSVGSWS
ncbi:MAG TPA: ester cyclase [Candidatus Nitrosocosmicus sp.]